MYTDIPEGYITGQLRDNSPKALRKVTHLYEGTFGDPGLPMCKRGWNRGDSYSIWRNNVSPAGICKVCLRRAQKGLSGVLCDEVELDLD